ncbi:MAG TPA: CBS domain-containing protein [Candidatus Nanoarchaeia archaeon]|nr:CBS domain-containing protein [Candidatus Nanoarchaeia archaeon]
MKHINHILVADLMTREPLSIKPETNLLDCAKIMVKKKTGSLLLVLGKRLIGIISLRDILWALVKKSKEDLSKIKAVDISPRKIATISPLRTIGDALKKMKNLKFERLPVIQNNELVGILTIKDILNFHPEIYPELDEYSEIREEEEKLNRIRKKGIVDGICERCGTRDMLVKFNGMRICVSCRDSL